MKRFYYAIFAIVVLIITFSVISCQKDVTDITQEEWLASGRYHGEYSYIQKHPNGVIDPENAPDVNYTSDDFIMYTDKPSYTIQELKDGKINATLIPADHYEGVMTTYYSPIMEKYKKGEWHRLYYFTDEIIQGYHSLEYFKWRTYDTKNMVNDVNITLEYDYFYPEPTPGKYRIVMFMGKNCKVYAEFELTK